MLIFVLMAVILGWIKRGDECEENEDGEEELRVSDESESEDVIEN